MKIFNRTNSALILSGIFLCFFATAVSGQNMFRKVNDFDGEGKADFAVTRDVGGARYWYVWQTTNGFGVFQWGAAGDQNAPGDFDGDGKFDYGVLRDEFVPPNNRRYQFWIYASQTGVRSLVWTDNNSTNSVPYQ